ncbi:MAG: HPr family phosphocarrier protein [Oliverpabstia sp.]
MTMTIRLDSIKKVEEFVGITSRYSGKIEVSSGVYTVDGKSIIGIFSLELGSNLCVKIDDVKDFQSFIQELQPYIVASGVE